MNMKKGLICAALSLSVSLNFLVPALAQTAPDRQSVQAQIRKEGMENSQIMKTLSVLTDRYGPRLTGSPNHKAAAEWAAKQMLSWGFSAARLEPWNFGHPGWMNEHASGFLTSPISDNLTFEVLAWTPSTNGAVSGEAFSLVVPDRPTQQELTSYFDTIKTKISGKMILVGKPALIPVNFNPAPKRTDDETLKRRFDPNNPGGTQQFPMPPAPQQKPGALSPAQVAEQLDAFLVANKASVRINDAGREHGQIRAFNNRTFDISKTVPTVVMRNEDFGRIFRLVESGASVALQFDIKNNNYPEGATSYNTIGEIAGSDKADEVIMLGGHLDSWHAATGATDNAIGCSIMMEAARILKSLGIKPRRTIRVALWSGEEQGLLGSQAYIKEHFGSFEETKPGYEKFGGYFNIDSGTGKARGMSIFGPPESATILREALTGFSDYGFMGVIATKSRSLGGSDHTSFNQAGLPGIGVQQDPIEYGTHTWHTNLDTYERIVEDDVKKAAIVIAAAVYELAMRDELVPRVAAADMPVLPVNR